MLSRSRSAQSLARMPPQPDVSRAIEAAALGAPEIGSGRDRAAIQSQHRASLRCSAAGRGDLQAVGTIPAGRRLKRRSGNRAEFMQSVEEQLAAIGFGGGRSETTCWRAVRLD